MSNNFFNKYYIVEGNIFESGEGRRNAKSRALSYCKKHHIDYENIIEINNDTELAYYKYLCEKKSRGEIISIKTHQLEVLINGFHNCNGVFIAPMMTSIPFEYVDADGKEHYDWVVGTVIELKHYVVDSKYLFDLYNVQNNKCLTLFYLDDDGSFKEWEITEIENVRKKFRQKAHKEMLDKLFRVRELEKYDRLKKLRQEGKITENQRKELYKMEVLYSDYRQEKD